MPRRRTMTEKREVLRRLRLGQGIRQIKRETGMHRTQIREIKACAEVQGWLSTDVELPSTEVLEHALSSALDNEQSVHPLDQFKARIEQWRRAELSFIVIHRLIAEQYPCSEATVRRYIHRQFPVPLKPVMLRSSIPGEVMEVDFGYLGLTWDEVSNRNRKTWVFSARLRYSRHAWRLVCRDQKQETFLLFHCLAFEAFGGVVEKVVPDNLKAAVIQASFEDPECNRLYQLLALHYGFLISPCLPAHPEHKGGVESDIKYVKRNFWPLFCERERQRGHEVPHYRDLQSELERWDRETADCRQIKGVGKSPAVLFTEESRVLKPLPGERWARMSIGLAKVQESWRIQFDCAYYSVPYRYVGQKVTVIAVNNEVQIYLGEQQIACHRQAEHPWQTVRNPLHAPVEPERYMSETRERLLEQAQAIGANTVLVVRTILSRRPVDGMRPVRALLALGRKYGYPRMECACTRALLYDVAEFGAVKRIIEHNLDREPLEDPVESTGQRQFRFTREAGYFDPAVNTRQEVAR